MLPLARDQLIRYAWPDKDVVDPSSVNLVVSRLRRKLELHMFDARGLETVSRFGYQISTSQLPKAAAFPFLDRMRKMRKRDASDSGACAHAMHG